MLRLVFPTDLQKPSSNCLTFPLATFGHNVLVLHLDCRYVLAMVQDGIQLRDGEAFIVDLILNIFSNNVSRIFNHLSIWKLYIVGATVQQWIRVVVPLNCPSILVKRSANNFDGLELPILRQHELGIDQSIVCRLLVKLVASSIFRGLSEIRNGPWCTNVPTMLWVVFIRLRRKL